MSEVIVFGSMNMDLSVAVDRVPAAGETILGSEVLTNPGGKGANQAVAASRLGARVRMVAAVGADAFGGELVRGLEGAGVDCALVRSLADVPTGMAVILRSGGDNRIVVAPGANHALGEKDVSADLRAHARSGDVLVAQGECDPAATFAALRTARELGLYTIFNPAPALAVPDDAWGCVDLVCLNETESQVMCGVLPTDEKTCGEVAQRLRALGAGAVVITLGGEGSYGMDAGGESLLVPAIRARVVDTTGAGDTFVGALAAARTRGRALADAMAWGTAAASVTVGRLGAQASIPTAEEADQALAAWRRDGTGGQR